MLDKAIASLSLRLQFENYMEKCRLELQAICVRLNDRDDDAPSLCALAEKSIYLANLSQQSIKEPTVTLHQFLALKKALIAKAKITEVENIVKTASRELRESVNSDSSLGEMVAQMIKESQDNSATLANARKAQEVINLLAKGK